VAEDEVLACPDPLSAIRTQNNCLIAGENRREAGKPFVIHRPATTSFLAKVK
jgi:hypothetical protein